MNKDARERLCYLDNIKWCVIILVVIIHLNVTYSGMGLWYYNEPHAPDMFSFVMFGTYGSFAQAFTMGILFFIAGYFTPKSLDKKGPRHFIEDRLVRLGIPTLLYMLIINPLIVLIISWFNHIQSGLLLDYVHYVISFEFLSGSGPLWFCVALLLFSVMYAFIRLLTGKETGTRTPFVLSHAHVIGILLVLSLASFLFRILWPAGPKAYTFCNLQLGNFAQYSIMFVLGMFVYRKSLLERIDYRFGRAWFVLALVVGIPMWAWLIHHLIGSDAKNLDLYMSGIHWQSLAYATWESLMCIGMSLGLIVIFRKNYDRQGRIAQLMSQNAFAVYVFHPVIVVVITLSLRSLVLYPLLKMVLMAIVIIPICFICCYYLRKIPVMKMLFS